MFYFVLNGFPDRRRNRRKTNAESGKLTRFIEPRLLLRMDGYVNVRLS